MNFNDKSISINISNRNAHRKLDEIESLPKIITQILPHLNYSQSLTYEELSELYQSLEQVSKHDRVLSDIYNDFKNKHYCEECHEICKIIHSCNAALCKVHVKANNYKCPSCQKKLKPRFLHQLFGKPIFCVLCNEKKIHQDSDHLCFSCLMNKDFNFGCEICLNAQNKIRESMHECYKCRKSFHGKKEKVVNFCDIHAMCNNCAEYCIGNNSCSCGEPLKIGFVKDFYEYVYGVCKVCKEFMKKNEMTRKLCCQSLVCENCSGFCCTSLRSEYEDD